MESTKIESKIKALIEKLVGSHWGSTESVCYLSTIGIYLNGEIPGYRDAIPMGLREFIRRNPVVQVVEFPGVEQKVGAVPLSVSLPDDVRGLFSRQGQPPGSRAQRVAYVKDFWEAFLRPIEGHSRHVVLEESGRVTVSEGPPDEECGVAYEITPQDLSISLPNEPVATKVEATHSAIERWLEKQSLPPRVFARPRRQRRDVVVGGRLARLIDAFGGLPEEDLSRISIPVDILIRLSSIGDD